MNNTICINNKYSTTKILNQLIEDNYLDENGKIKEECKFNLNFPELGIVDSKIPAKESEKFTEESKAFDTHLFLPEGEGRKGEGGLRTKGYFKRSYDDKPLVSIITVVFNGEQFLEETIQSVINQTYDNVEYIIIDGGSTDGTLDIIKKYEDYIDYWVSEKDHGIYDAWNKAVCLSLGDWIAFLGADDFYLNDAIENYVSLLNQSREIHDYISSKVELITTDKQKIKIIGNAWRWKVFKKYMNVAHVGSLHNKNYFKKFGLYETTYKIAADYEMLLRKKEKLKASYLDVVTAKMRNAGVSNTQIKQSLKETFFIKTKTAHICKYVAFFDYVLANIKFITKKLLNVI